MDANSRSSKPVISSIFGFIRNQVDIVFPWAIPLSLGSKAPVFQVALCMDPLGSGVGRTRICAKTARLDVLARRQWGSWRWGFKTNTGGLRLFKYKTWRRASRHDDWYGPHPSISVQFNFKGQWGIGLGNLWSVGGWLFLIRAMVKAWGTCPPLGVRIHRIP